MRKKAYIIPKGSRMFTAAAVCMVLQFAAITLMHCLLLKNHIPFFGNIIGDTFGMGTREFFVLFLIDDILLFVSRALPIVGVLLARRNLWTLIVGWLCVPLLWLYESFTHIASGGWVSCGCAVCAALTLILVQTGCLRSKKVAVIALSVSGAGYFGSMLPSVSEIDNAVLLLSFGDVLRYVSCALLIGALLFKIDAVSLPEPIAEVNSD